MVVDLTDGVPPTTISLQVANNPSALVNTLKDLEKLSTEAPVVEKSEQVEEVETSDYSSSIQDVKFYDYFGTMDRTLRTGAYYLSDVLSNEPNINQELLKENVVASAHIASNMKDTLYDMGKAIYIGIKDYLLGNKIDNEL